MKPREPWPTVLHVEDTIVDALERHYPGISVTTQDHEAGEINVTFRDARRADIEISWHEES